MGHTASGGGRKEVQKAESALSKLYSRRPSVGDDAPLPSSASPLVAKVALRKAALAAAMQARGQALSQLNALSGSIDAAKNEAQVLLHESHGANKSAVGLIAASGKEVAWRNSSCTYLPALLLGGAGTWTQRRCFVAP